MKQSAKYIENINMNGLRGRMFRLPSSKGKSREILIVNGYRCRLEQLYPLAKDLSKYGSVSIPDLPGFGGMQSFYRIYEKPTTDNFAGYLAAFIKLRYKNRRITIIGLGYGFTVATRMLQNFPSLASKVDLIASLSGFVHWHDFQTKRPSATLRRYSLSLASQRFPAWLAKTFVPKSTRTYLAVERSKLNINICNKAVNLPVHHVCGPSKQYDNDVLEQHLHVIYSKVKVYKRKNQLDLEQVLTSSKSTAKLIPTDLRKAIAKA